MKKPRTHPGFAALVNHGQEHPGFGDDKDSNKAAKKIHIDPAHKGKLHERLHIPEGQPIPEDRLKSAEHSGDPSLRSEAQFADNAKKFKHS